MKIKWNSPAGKSAKPTRQKIGGVKLAKQKAAENLLAFQFDTVGVKGWVREYVFHDVRQWRLDFAWLDELLALEINGGTFRKGGGAHTGAGFKRDVEKYCAAYELGWTVIVVMPENVRQGRALQVVERRLRIIRQGWLDHARDYDAGHLKGYQEGRADAMRQMSDDRELTR